MTFDEWFIEFFKGVNNVPEYIKWGYQQAYEKGVEEGRERIKCPGCGGKRSLQVRVQMNTGGGRFCINEEQPCPVCKGSGVATKEHLERFFKGEQKDERDQFAQGQWIK
jgi:DnaJ-class molecular chaperone